MMNDAHPTTIRVAAKTALPDLFRIIREDLVPLFAQLRVEANYLYRIHLLRTLSDHQHHQLFCSQNSSSPLDKQLHRKVFRAVTTLRGNASVPDDLTDACVLYRANRHQGLQYIDRGGLSHLIETAADRHATITASGCCSGWWCVLSGGWAALSGAWGLR
jgi:hypothetical protein